MSSLSCAVEDGDEQQGEHARDPQTPMSTQQGWPLLSMLAVFTVLVLIAGAALT